MFAIKALFMRRRKKKKNKDKLEVITEGHDKGNANSRRGRSRSRPRQLSESRRKASLSLGDAWQTVLLKDLERDLKNFTKFEGNLPASIDISRGLDHAKTEKTLGEISRLLHRVDTEREVLSDLLRFGGGFKAVVYKFMSNQMMRMPSLKIVDENTGALIDLKTKLVHQLIRLLSYVDLEDYFELHWKKTRVKPVSLSRDKIWRFTHTKTIISQAAVLYNLSPLEERDIEVLHVRTIVKALSNQIFSPKKAVGETVDGSIECKSKRGVSDLCNLSLTSPIWMRIIQLTNQVLGLLLGEDLRLEVDSQETGFYGISVVEEVGDMLRNDVTNRIFSTDAVIKACETSRRKKRVLIESTAYQVCVYRRLFVTLGRWMRSVMMMAKTARKRMTRSRRRSVVSPFEAISLTQELTQMKKGTKIGRDLGEVSKILADLKFFRSEKTATLALLASVKPLEPKPKAKANPTPSLPKATGAGVGVGSKGGVSSIGKTNSGKDSGAPIAVRSNRMKISSLSTIASKASKSKVSSCSKMSNSDISVSTQDGKFGLRSDSSVPNMQSTNQPNSYRDNTTVASPRNKSSANAAKTVARTGAKIGLKMGSKMGSKTAAAKTAAAKTAAGGAMADNSNNMTMTTESLRSNASKLTNGANNTVNITNTTRSQETLKTKKNDTINKTNTSTTSTAGYHNKSNTNLAREAKIPIKSLSNVVGDSSATSGPTRSASSPKGLKPSDPNSPGPSSPASPGPGPVGPGPAPPSGPPPSLRVFTGKHHDNLLRQIRTENLLDRKMKTYKVNLVGQQVALKVFGTFLMPSYVREGLLVIQKLSKCPNLVGMFGLGYTLSHGWYGVLEYLPITLEEFHPELELIPSHVTCKMAAGIANGVAVLHEHGLTHGSLAPNAILVSPRFEVKITDIPIPETLSRGVRMMRSLSILERSANVNGKCTKLKTYYRAPETFLPRFTNSKPVTPKDLPENDGKSDDFDLPSDAPGHAPDDVAPDAHHAHHHPPLAAHHHPPLDAHHHPPLDAHHHPPLEPLGFHSSKSSKNADLPQVAARMSLASLQATDIFAVGLILTELLANSRLRVHDAIPQDVKSHYRNLIKAAGMDVQSGSPISSPPRSPGTKVGGSTESTAGSSSNMIPRNLNNIYDSDSTGRLRSPSRLSFRTRSSSFHVDQKSMGPPPTTIALDLTPFQIPDIHRRAIVQCICLNPRDRPSARVLCDMVEQSQKGVELQRSKTPLGLRMPSSPPTSPTQNPLPRLPQESHASNQHTSPTPVTRDEKTASQYLRRHRRGGSMEETFSLVLTSVFGARDSDGNRAPSGLATASASRSPTRSRQQSASNSNQNQSTDKRDSKRSSGMTLVCMSDSNNPTMSFKSDSASSRAGSREGSPGPILKLRESRRRFDSLRNAHRRTTSGPPERQVGPGTANYTRSYNSDDEQMGTSMTHFNKGTSMTHFNNSGPTQDGQEYRNLRRIYTEQNPNIPRRRSSEPFICPVLSRATSGPGFVPAPPPPPLTNLSISFVPSYAHTRR